MDLPQLILQPIGIIRTPYREKQHAPRQPGADKKTTEGIIELLPDRNFDQALEYLEGFERIWIIFWFHQNAGWKPKVLPPRSGRTKRGVFATRSPHRPNPIGLSLCRLLEVSGRTIRVENPDLLDGTPVLDLKPYIPYAEAFPDAEIGWLAEAEHNEAAPYAVTVAPLAAEQAAWLEKEHGVHLLERAVDVLSFDPHPHSYRRIMQLESGGLVMAIKSWRVLFHLEGNAVTIRELRSGYPPEAIALRAADASGIHDHAAHIAFHSHWQTQQL
ncbi:MAG: tRNA (N6-threonylcarbamoyladenosine(37)-N6)-methyltransferase TrmO [Bacteroidetes bacterium]|nr:tRNA (N6-threonylcarbamoyladenosine(37)-N6)-methyltransferase TrmO [Bacteroidota bacterium]